jgi:transcriptional regulator with XRE-family HTH domain
LTTVKIEDKLRTLVLKKVIYNSRMEQNYTTHLPLWRISVTIGTANRRRDMNIGVLLEAEMRDRHLSMREAAEEIGVTHTTISRILRGRPVSVTTLTNVARFLKIDPGNLLETENVDEQLTKDIMTIIGHEPALAGVMHEVAEKAKSGEIPPETFREIIRYAMWRLRESAATTKPDV